VYLLRVALIEGGMDCTVCGDFTEESWVGFCGVEFMWGVLNKVY
jgi:hypothetical protein